MKQEVRGGKAGVGHSVEVFVANGRQVAEVDTAMIREPGIFAAVDHDVMTALHQADREFFGEGFKASIARRNAARGGP